VLKCHKNNAQNLNGLKIGFLFLRNLNLSVDFDGKCDINTFLIGFSHTNAVQYLLKYSLHQCAGFGQFGCD